MLSKEAIDRLLIDQALGALDEDVDALLRDYQRSHPSIASDVSELQQIVSTAKKAMQPQETIVLPPLRIAHTNRWSIVNQVTAMAACAALGVLSTVLWLGKPTTTVVVKPTDPPAVRSGVVTVHWTSPVELPVISTGNKL